jgi:homoprotocatechuate degradation regulator HpaR
VSASPARRVGAERLPTTRASGFLRDIELSLPLQLLKAREAAMARFRPMLRSHGITEQQWRVIRVLAADEALDGRELARRSILLAPSLTRILQYFEKQNLVKRSAHISDQRRVMFALTARGRRLFDEVAPDAEALYAAIADQFGGQKLKTLYKLLAEFSTALGSEAGE